MNAARPARLDGARADGAPHPSAAVAPIRPAAGGASALYALWAGTLKYDAADPAWPDRDRFVLADPSCARLVAALLAATGHPAGAEYPLLPAADPDMRPRDAGRVIRVGAGQALAAAVGMAVAERVLAARFGRSLVDHRTWVVAGPADLGCGLGHEAISLAGALRLSRLGVLHPFAGTVSDGLARHAHAAGWAVRHAPDADPVTIAAALSFVLRGRKPTLILCHGDGGLPAPPDCAELSRWQGAGARGAPTRRAWLRRLAQHPLRAEFDRGLARRRADEGRETLVSLRGILAATEPAPSPLEAARQAVYGLLASVPDLVIARAGSEAPTDAPPQADVYRARILDCGGRTSGLGVSLVGMALHGGLLPVGWAAAEAADCLRPALRLAALWRLPVVCLLAEDDAGAAAGGMLAALRAIPGLLVLRPADAVETIECCDIALRRTDGPSVLVLAPMPLPGLTRTGPDQRAGRGGYVAVEAGGPREATLIATGADLHAALAAQAALEKEGMAVAVAALPCWELFAGQDEACRDSILGTAPRIAVESGSALGWERWTGADDVFVTPSGTTAAAATEPDRSFGISSAAVIETVRARILKERAARS